MIGVFHHDLPILTAVYSDALPLALYRYWPLVLASGLAALQYSWKEVIGRMPRDPHALISTTVAPPVPEKRRADRLSQRAAIFWIGILSLTAWATMIVLAIALL
jgi:hypothetical protein